MNHSIKLLICAAVVGICIPGFMYFFFLNPATLLNGFVASLFGALGMTAPWGLYLWWDNSQELQP